MKRQMRKKKHHQEKSNAIIVKANIKFGIALKKMFIVQ